MADLYQQIVLASRPTGAPVAENFRLESGQMPVPADGEVLVRARYLSLDPYMRGRMSTSKSYARPVEIGEPMEGETVAEVVESRHPDYRPGNLVQARSGWRTHAAISVEGLRRIDPALAPITTVLGVLGMPGFTAYSGMKVIGQPKPGETVVVAAASGPVGSLVGQLARLAGARVVGIAGGAEKCAYVRDVLAFDAVVDHRSEGLAEKLAKACPNGIDVYFENVGGPIWQAVLPLLNRFARVPVCGVIAHYNGAGGGERDQLPITMLEIVRRSLLVRGFINVEFVEEHYDAFLREIGPRVRSGDISYREDIVDGLEKAPEAFIGMLAGRNFGKALVRLS
ncbi:NADP-dependent oxidoreductase [Paraburkholderia sp. GAS32]|uniref:NADP-dependent oxidoreductase n=1 Tax=Paraburkholderia sp. GAS32 TaxID=3035129 RepID=UPI003D1F8F20